MGSFAADSFALLTTPDELSEDHLKSTADALEVQIFNKSRRGSTLREQLFTATAFHLSKRRKSREDEGRSPLYAFALSCHCVLSYGDRNGKSRNNHKSNLIFFVVLFFFSFQIVIQNT